MAPTTPRRPRQSFGLATITLAWYADRMRLGQALAWALLPPLAVAD